MSHHDGAAHVHDLIKDQRTAMLTTVHDESRHARPRARWRCQQADPDGTLWFLAFADSEKTEEIRRRPDVNVAFTEEGKWVSVAGRASVRQDPAKATRAVERLRRGVVPVRARRPEGRRDPGRRRERRVLGQPRARSARSSASSRPR